MGKTHDLGFASEDLALERDHAILRQVEVLPATLFRRRFERDGEPPVPAADQIRKLPDPRLQLENASPSLGHAALHALLDAVDLLDERLERPVPAPLCRAQRLPERGLPLVHALPARGELRLGGSDARFGGGDLLGEDGGDGSVNLGEVGGDERSGRWTEGAVQPCERVMVGRQELCKVCERDVCRRIRRHNVERKRRGALPDERLSQRLG